MPTEVTEPQFPYHVASPWASYAASVFITAFRTGDVFNFLHFIRLERIKFYANILQMLFLIMFLTCNWKYRNRFVTYLSLLTLTFYYRVQ